ncbi:hypothetical protein [Halobacteriovorax sp. YZS-1-1]|uniref:hypothetical protein n=1 Tax=unclassified Halobacteriovorax TaxID=2639665 RepID=UPI003999DD1B
MKNISIILFLLFSISAHAECESVDLTIKSVEYGLKSTNDLAEAINCNLAQMTNSNQLCGTKIGLKKDIVEMKQRLFDFGMITKLELAEAKSALSEQVEVCK